MRLRIPIEPTPRGSRVSAGDVVLCVLFVALVAVSLALEWWET